jgi:steroid delta-isomerase-like uncharacterized protein
VENRGEAMSGRAERTKEVVRRYQDAYNNNDIDTVAELLDPEWKSNSFPSEVLPQTVENLKVLQEMVLGAFPDIHYTTHELIAEGDVVVQSWTVRGTHKGEFVGLAPTGDEMELGGISIFEIQDGKIVRHTAFNDVIPLLHQCGAELPPEWVAFSHHPVDRTV